jgi:hypothetical protein
MQHSSYPIFDSPAQTDCGKLVVRPAPHADEGFIGYLIRLTDLNHYETSTRILQLANLGDRLYKVSIAFNNQLDLTSLANLVGVGEKRLSALLFQSVKQKRPKYGDYLVFEHAVPRIVIKSNSHKVCPPCLLEYGYIRKIWDLLPVTACPIHKCLLLDECPNCGGRLRFTRPRVSICWCEYDWRKASVVSVSDNELELTRRLHTLCDLPGRAEEGVFDVLDNPLSKLSLKDLLSTVFFVASQYRSTSNLKSRRVLVAKFGERLRNADIHQLLSRAALVFQDWPTNYYKFLDWRKGNSHATQQKRGVWKDFGPLESALYMQLTASTFDFLRQAFEEYIATKWDGGYTRQFRRLNRTARRNKKFVSLDEARGLLKLGSEKIDCLIKSGNLTAKVRGNGRARVVLIETTSIDRFKALRRDLLDRKQTSKRLGINSIQTRVLAEANLLTEFDSFDGRSSAFYSIKEIDGLIDTLTNLARPNRSSTSARKIDFSQALYALVCQGDLGVDEFVRAMLEGSIRPCGIAKKPGLRALCFSRADILNYQQNSYKKRYLDALSTVEAAKVLRTHPKIVRFLIKKNLLGSRRIRWWLSIPQSAIAEFLSKYVLTQALAKEFKTSTRYITNILEIEGIEPISFTKVHYKPSYYVYDKSVIDYLSLSRLIEEKRQVVTLQSQLLDVAAASRFLNIPTETLSEIIANGILTPHVTERRKHPQKGYFTLRHLRRLKWRVDSYDGLMTVQVAAQLCAMSVKRFNARLVAKKHLGVFHVEGDRTRYFPKTEVEKLADELKNLLDASDVRSLLALSESQVLRLTNCKALKPIYGPSVDGSGVNLFLKSEVEALRTQRRAFKRQRVRAGGSARFGSQAGPSRSPVIETIAPRVTQLLQSAKANKNRVSGGSLHKQLLDEGYDVGINSVYVCLRNVRSLGVGSALPANG